MAIRNMLHVNHTEDFTKFMESKGFKVEPIKGAWEHIRYRSATECVIFYRRFRESSRGTMSSKLNDHLSFDSRYYKYVREFLKQRK